MVETNEKTEQREESSCLHPGTSHRPFSCFAHGYILCGLIAVALLLAMYAVGKSTTSMQEQQSDGETGGLSANTEILDNNGRGLNDDREQQELPSVEKLQIIESSPEYPKPMVDFAEKYEQVIDYVYDYPRLKDQRPEIDLDGISLDSVPLLIQWDARWGYIPYGDGLIGYTGCGPVCLAMVAIYLTKDVKWTPAKTAQIAYENGYYVSGEGSSWTLISEGCQFFGLKAETLPLVESTLKRTLDNGSPIIAALGPRDFTYSGHYIVLTGYTDSGFTVNDPNSYDNSTKTWAFEEIRDQILNLWAMSKA